MAILQSNKSNHVGSKLVSAIIRFIGMEGEVKTSTLYLAAECTEDMEILLAKVELVKSQGEDSIRGAMQEYWEATPEGEELLAKHAKLKAIPAKQRTQVQREQFNIYTLAINSMSTKMQRAVFTYQGAKVLRENGRVVDIDKVAGAKQYLCLVRSKSEKEFTKFTGDNLRQITALNFTKDTPSGDIQAECIKASGRAGAPGTPSGDTALTAKQVGETVKAVDATVAGMVDDKGRLATTKGNVAELSKLYARLHNMLTAEQRKAALEAFKAEGAEEPAKQVA